jgi:hypothetical protein
LFENDAASTRELNGVIVAWSDGKGWWPYAFGQEPDGDSRPKCKSSDMAFGMGDPLSNFNRKELQLLEEGKLERIVSERTVEKDGIKKTYVVCETCPHNQFGTAENGDGKACRDMRFFIMLLDNGTLPIVVRAPATSLGSVRDYFKRLTSNRLKYYHVVTSLSLRREQGGPKKNIPYSVIDAKAIRPLNDQEKQAALEYHNQMQPLLEEDDAVEALTSDKTEKTEEKPGESKEATAQAHAGYRPMGTPQETADDKKEYADF